MREQGGPEEARNGNKRPSDNDFALDYGRNGIYSIGAIEAQKDRTMETLNPIANITLNALADAARSSLYPEPRGSAIARTLAQIGERCSDMPLSVADVCAGLELLSRPQDGDPADVTSRRLTCLELSCIAKTMDVRGGYPLRLARCFSVIADEFAGSDDQRILAIARTAKREASELREQA